MHLFGALVSKEVNIDSVSYAIIHYLDDVSRLSYCFVV
jgi:hypothetical protein